MPLPLNQQMRKPQILSAVHSTRKPPTPTLMEDTTHLPLVSGKNEHLARVINLYHARPAWWGLENHMGTETRPGLQRPSVAQRSLKRPCSTATWKRTHISKTHTALCENLG